MNTAIEVPVGLTWAGGAYMKLQWLLAILFLIGAGTFLSLLLSGTESVPWPFLLANFMFLIGVSQFGVCFSAILHLCRAKWARPFYRLGEIMTLAFLPFAFGVFLLIFFFGRHELFYWLDALPEDRASPWLSSNGLLFRNLGAQLVFYGLAIYYFIVGLLPDVSEQNSQSGPNWRRNLYRRLFAIKVRHDQRQLKARVYLLAPAVLIIYVVVNTIIALDFGMMLVEHYHSTVYAMFFIQGNNLAGTAAILLLSTLLIRSTTVREYFGVNQLKSMGIMLTGFVLLWLYLFWAQFFVTWFGNLPNEFGPLWKQMYGHYGPYFWAMISCVFFIPLLAFLKAETKKAWWSLLLVSAIICSGVWINRYLMVVPIFLDDHQPFSSLTDIALTIGLTSGFLVVLLWLLNAFPVVSAWELNDAKIEDDPSY
ncbi:MAG TPA: hypothetical protein EYM99_03050 [Alphaproteobacteria bacterium]|nr:hypothetical protein [Alphaproteobacteria bacterium]